MARLAGIDAAFLYLETPSAHMHVVGTIIVDPASGSTSALANPNAAIERTIAARLAAIPRMRRRVVEVPLGLEHPVWVDDPTFRIRNHIRRRTLRGAGSQRQLTDLVGKIASSPLDRSRPLWELWSVRGLAGGRLALVVKVHHAAMDGSTGTDVLAQLLDLQPCEQPQRVPRSKPIAGGPLPSAAALVRSAVTSWSERPMKLARALGDTGLFAYRALFEREQGPPPTLPFTGPRTVFNEPISSERAVAFGSVPLADIKAIKGQLGMTVNDIVLAGCTMTLRHYLQEHGGVPARPLVASIPVAVSHADQSDTVNRVSAMCVGLPVQIEDPLAQLQAVAADAARGKQLQRAVGPSLVQRWAQVLPPGLVAQGAQLFWRYRLAGRMRPLHSLIVSNVPGPRVPLYAAGARVVEVYPLGPILEGAGMNVTVFSYEDSVHFGIITCRRAVPDPAPIARGFEAAVAGLVQACAPQRLHRRRQPRVPDLVAAAALSRGEASYARRLPRA